ncbi:MAG: hypothetical protein AB4290_20280 [Spirulina sp.]
MKTQQIAALFSSVVLLLAACIPTAQTPTQTPTQTPKPVALNLNIESPSNEDEVPRTSLVTGRASGDFSNKHLWVVVNPKGTPGWYPQSGEFFPVSEQWSVQVYVGLEGDHDVGKSFDIAVVTADDKAHKHFNKYLKEAKFPEEPLPSGTTVLDIITVKRR